jgi:L-iditol 2-dehydrogenase
MPTSSCVYPADMLAARLHGPSDLRLERVPHPGPPGAGEALLRVSVTGICGSDLHTYQDARIGDTAVRAPMILGHEFAGVVEDVGAGAVDGFFQPLRPGTRVAVDPAQPCHRCEMCEQGHPNLCRQLRFCSNYPYDGSLCQWMHMPAHCCFPVPDNVDQVAAALLEPLGVAIHAVDLAHLRVAHGVVILGAGSIGLCLLQVARLAGADPIFVLDPFPWRRAVAERLGGVPVPCDAGGRRDGTANPAELGGQPQLDAAVEFVLRETQGRGVDVAIEAAWGDQSVEQAAAMTRLGGRLVLVGIPSDDRLALKHSTARRKGLSILMSRRMKHCYPRAIRLAERGQVDLCGLVSHRFPLPRAAEALALNSAYEDHVVKVVIESHE